MSETTALPEIKFFEDKDLLRMVNIVTGLTGIIGIIVGFMVTVAGILTFASGLSITGVLAPILVIAIVFSVIVTVIFLLGASIAPIIYLFKLEDRILDQTLGATFITAMNYSLKSWLGVFTVLTSSGEELFNMTKDTSDPEEQAKEAAEKAKIEAAAKKILAEKEAAQATQATQAAPVATAAQSAPAAQAAPTAPTE